MIKRILLLVVFGVSFTPVAFAADVTNTGQRTYSQIMEEAPLSVACTAKADAVKGSDTDSNSSSVSSKSSASDSR